eukprot:1207566-Ditylum_brightwellii.AAC.1
MACQEENENTKNHGSVVHTPDHINGQEAKETIDEPSYHDEELVDSTLNNTVFIPEDLPQEDNENAMKHISLDEGNN